MFDILSIIPGKKKRASKGWYSFNAVCCHHQGHRPDDRSRAGIVFEDNNDWTYHCFNCGFSTKFVLGKSIAPKARDLLRWCGIDEEQINKWSFESFRHRNLIDIFLAPKPKWIPSFETVELPEAELIDPTNEKHKVFVDYLQGRGIKYDEYPFMVTPDEQGRNSNRIIIPYTFEGKVVGHTSRYLDNRTPKFIKEQQTGYVFGYDFQKPNWEVCLVVEGIFDALSINACALTHDTISDEQAEVLRKLHRKVIVVPDLDKTGLNICDRALELGFHVSIPNWDDGIKDANDAVVRYGKLPTLLSILQNATNSKIKLELMRKKIAKRI